MKKSLAQLIRDREVDSEQAELWKRFLANPPKIWSELEKMFGPLKVERIRRLQR